MTKDVSAFSWMSATEVARALGVMAVTRVRWMVSCLAGGRVGTIGCIESLFEGRLGGCGEICEDGCRLDSLGGCADDCLLG